MVAPGLFSLMAGHALVKANKLNKQKIQLANQDRIAAIHKMMDEKLGGEVQTEDETRFMPQNSESDVNNPNEKNEVQSTDLSALSSIPLTEQDKKGETYYDSMKAIKYCRHCGRKVDYDSSIYCKYCGKEL